MAPTDPRPPTALAAGAGEERDHQDFAAHQNHPSSNSSSGNTTTSVTPKRKPLMIDNPSSTSKTGTTPTITRGNKTPTPSSVTKQQQSSSSSMRSWHFPGGPLDFGRRGEEHGVFSPSYHPHDGMQVSFLCCCFLFCVYGCETNDCIQPTSRA